MYPYNLGYHIKARRICRIPRYCIPVGTIKILRYKIVYQGFISPLWVDPYAINGELQPWYWSILRAQDLDYELKKQEERILEKI